MYPNLQSRESKGRKRRLPGRYLDHIVDFSARCSYQCAQESPSSNRNIFSSVSSSEVSSTESQIEAEHYYSTLTNSWKFANRDSDFYRLQTYAPTLYGLPFKLAPTLANDLNNLCVPSPPHDHRQNHVYLETAEDLDCVSRNILMQSFASPGVQAFTMNSPKKEQAAKKQKKVSFATEAQVQSAEVVDEASVRHLCHFLLLQLRSQCSLILDMETEFDKKLRSLDSSIDDVLCCEGLMRQFFAGPALGDKWVPWNTACGDHERYIVTRIYSLPNLNEKQKYLLHFAFRASSHPPFFDAVIIPMFENSSKSSTMPSCCEEGIRMLEHPKEVLHKGSRLHSKYTEYRDSDGANRKLHTICYRNHPPKGCGGGEYSGYMVERTAEFIEIGQSAYQTLVEIKQGVAPKDKLCKVLCACNGIGPTLSKMFLVTTQLLYPELGLLDESCQVGDGASPALSLLFGLEGFSLKPTHRGILLIRLLRYLERTIEELEPRFLPMLGFTVEHTREFLSSKVPPEAIPDRLTPYELQVNLCEWRKFLNIDKMRKVCRGCSEESLSFTPKKGKIPPKPSSRRALSFLP